MLSYKSINRAVDKSMILVIITFVLFLMGSTPESSEHLTTGIKEFSTSLDIFGVSPVIDIPPTQPVPIILEWIAVIWFIYFSLKGVNAKFKSLSPQIFGEGLQQSIPYCGRSSIHIDGKIVSIQGGGTAAPFLPYEGPTLISAPATHVHVSGEHVIITAELFPNQPVAAIPIESKTRTLPQREGYNGINNCAAGWISPVELKVHPIIKKIEKNAKGKDETIELDTQTIILTMNQSNEAVDRLFEMMRYKVDTLKLDLSLINQLTKGGMKPQGKSLASKLFKPGA